MEHRFLGGQFLAYLMTLSQLHTSFSVSNCTVICDLLRWCTATTFNCMNWWVQRLYSGAANIWSETSTQDILNRSNSNAMLNPLAINSKFTVYMGFSVQWVWSVLSSGTRCRVVWGHVSPKRRQTCHFYQIHDTFRMTVLCRAWGPIEVNKESLKRPHV
jgi:hypothetical protein